MEKWSKSIRNNVKTLSATLAGLLLSTKRVQAFSLGDQFLLNSDGTTVAGQFPTLGSLISTILPNVFIISGVVLLFLLFFGGFTIITSNGNPEQTQKGMQSLTAAIIGFVIIFSSYWIIQIIQIITGIPILNSEL